MIAITTTAKGRSDDGSDASTASSRVARRAVPDGIEQLKRIVPVTLQVALKTGPDAEMLTFSRHFLKIAVIFSTARTARRWNQQETVARVDALAG